MRNVLAAVLMAAALVLPARARASTISYSTTFHVDAFNASEVGTTFSAQLFDLRVVSLQRFNLPGTLQSVQMTLTSTYSVTLNGLAEDDRGTFDQILLPPITFNDHNDTYITLGLQSSLRIQLLNPSGFDGTTSLAPLTAECAEHHDSTARIFCQASATNQGNWNSDLPVAALGLAPFVGNGDMGLGLLALGTMFGNCDDDPGGDLDDVCHATGEINWQGTVTVDYTYTTLRSDNPPGGDDGPAAVPEPSTFILLGIGLVAASRGIARSRAL